MKAGIVIDAWKRAIFELYLSKAGRVYTVGKGLTHDLLTIYVNYADQADRDVLQRTIQAAVNEAERVKTLANHRGPAH